MEADPRGVIVSSRLMNPIVRGIAARSRGRSFDECAVRLGLDPEVLAEPDADSHISNTWALWRNAVELSGEPLIGLHCANEIRPDELGLVGYVLQYSRTMLQAIRRSRDVVDLLAKRGSHRMRFDVVGPSLIVDSSCSPPQANEFILYGMVVAGRHVDSRCKPRVVRFRHQALAPPSEYARIMGVAVEHGADRDELLGDWGALGRQVMGARPELSDLLIAHGRQLMDRFTPASSDDELKRIYLEEVQKDSCTISDIARRIRVGPRTLQRKLKKAGTTHRRMADDARCHIAKAMLEGGDLPISSIADDLGFSDHSAFVRAFRRWTGVTPGAYRQRAVA